MALKALSLRGSRDWKAIELFEREARVLSQLQHPSIPNYIDYFEVDTDTDRLFYIAQNLAPGASLQVKQTPRRLTSQDPSSCDARCVCLYSHDSMSLFSCLLVLRP